VNTYRCIADDVVFGEDVRLAKFINLYGCRIGDHSRIGAFVEIQKNAVVGQNCKISSHTFICEGVTIEDDCFVGHGVVFINDRYPRAVNAEGLPEGEGDWKNRFIRTRVGRRASIGSHATIMGGVSIGAGVLIGAGSVVVCDIPTGEIWAGNPARFLRRIDAP